MIYIAWLIIGLLAVTPLLLWAEKLKLSTTTLLLGYSLIIAAAIYIGFAAVWGDTYWLGFETLGVLGYGVFCWLAIKYSPLWLALGWLLHPLWDVVLHLQGPGAHVVPVWYAVACASFDVAVAAYIVYRVRKENQVGALV